VKKSTTSKTRASRTEQGSRSLIPALVAASGGLATLPATALELGDIAVNSSLGQPLRASIAYALAPNETLADTCVSLQGGASASGLPPVTRASVSVANGVISIAGKIAVSEPLMSMRVNIRCPYTPHLSRDYMLFIDPAQPLSAPVADPAAAAASEPVAAATPAPAVNRRRQEPAGDPIANAVRYRVQPGDTLSQIAQRIENRPVALWDAVAAIFNANSDAFIANDPNRLRAGSWLIIPDFGAPESVTIAAGPLFPADEAPVSSSSSAASTTYTMAYSQPAVEDTVPVDDAEPSTLPQAADEFEASIDAAPSIDTLQPGDLVPDDVVTDAENPFVVVDNTSVTIPDTQLEGPETASTSPNVATATIRPPAAESTTSSWLWWLVGSGLTIIAGLLLLSSRVRNRFGSTPGAAVASPRHPPVEIDTQKVEAVLEFDEAIVVDEAFVDDSPTDENLELDANLELGTGLQEGTDVDFAQDFGFAATTQLDIDLADEGLGTSEGVEPDEFPVVQGADDSILVSEVPAEDDEGDEEDDYEMSVIVNTITLPEPEDITERDLQAIAIDADEESESDEHYTVNQEVDFSLLEQDYEDELTATQALNQEIAKAAAELRANMQADDTAQVEVASLTDLDVTAQLPANDGDEIEIDSSMTVNLYNDDDTDETGVNPSIAVDMSVNDETVEMPRADDDDETVEMPANRSSKSA
jgi:cell envelope opacity-associated protein A